MRARLGGFGFSQDKALIPVADLSGGERARLNLALVTHDAPGLLILDEPTNHLDIETREELVRSINDFSGAVVLVSHDWHLVDLVADQLWLVADGTARPFAGDLEDYRRSVFERLDAEENKNSSEPDRRRRARRQAAATRLELGPLRRQARWAEEAIARWSEERAALDRGLAAPHRSTADQATVADKLKRRAELGRLIAQAETEWLAAQEAIETLPDRRPKT